MSKKVVLPKGVVDAIENMRNIGHSNELIITGVLKGTNHREANILRGYFEDCFDDLMSALINGYEVEQTPGDKVREYYQQATEDAGADDYELQQSGFERRDAIRHTINLLGIKIEGVNA